MKFLFVSRYSKAAVATNTIDYFTSRVTSKLSKLISGLIYQHKIQGFLNHTYNGRGSAVKQNARLQHLSLLKASAFLSLKKKIVVKKHYNLYLGLVTPSSGRCSPITGVKLS